MKKIINGKMYNTDTAKELAGWSSPGGWGDFSHYEETLYQKRTGEFFLFGEGGPMTRYAESAGQNQWRGGSKIIPLAWEDAREWAENKLDADGYEEIFGEVSEDESRTVVTLSISAGALERAKRAASQLGVSVSAYIESLI